MTRGRTLALNSLFNLAGAVAPLVAAIVAIPILIRQMGADRFGVLGIVWTAIGYFGLFDFGLGRALTLSIAQRLGTKEEPELSALAWSSLTAMFVLGLVGAAFIALLTPWAVTHALKMPDDLRGEARTAFYLLAVAMPVFITTIGLRGMLEAHRDFALATALRIPLGLFNFVGPLLVLPWSHRLGPIIGVLVAGRFVGWAMHLAVCVNRYGYLRGRFTIGAKLPSDIARLGGWMTVSNVVSPLMVSADRVLIGILISTAAVAYYVTPFEVVSKVWLFPQAVLGVLFPEFAAAASHDRARGARLVEGAVRVILVAVFPVALGFTALAPEGLTLWLGAEFGRVSAPLLQWLAAGVLINCVGQVAFAALQADARPDVTAKLHLVELPFYAVAIWLLVHEYGLRGVAMAWVLRVTVDTAALFVVIARRLPNARAPIASNARTLIALLAVLAVIAVVPSTASRVALLVVGLSVFAPFAWWRLLSADERLAIRSWFRRKEGATA
ncbi:MAG TPA: flippase [Gemmatimonadaceae bacterium]